MGFSFKTKKPQCLWSFLTLFSLHFSGQLPKGPSVCWNTTHTLDTISPLSGCPGFWTAAPIQNSGCIHSGWEMSGRGEPESTQWEILSPWHLGVFLLPAQEESSVDGNYSRSALLVPEHSALSWGQLHFIPCSQSGLGHGLYLQHPISLVPIQRGKDLHLHLHCPEGLSCPQDASWRDAKQAVSQQTQARVKQEGDLTAWGTETKHDVCDFQGTYAHQLLQDPFACHTLSRWMQKPWNPCLTESSAACAIFLCSTKDGKKPCFHSSAPHTASEHDQLCAPLACCFPCCPWGASLCGVGGWLCLSTAQCHSRSLNEMFLSAEGNQFGWEVFVFFFYLLPSLIDVSKKGEGERKWMNENPLNLPSSLNVCVVSNCLILPLLSSASCCTCNSRKLPPKLPSLVWDPRTPWL